MEAQKLYLPYGAKVRRRQLPGEPGNEVGKVLGMTLGGDKTFVQFGGGARKKMLFIDTDQLERVFSEGGK